MVTPAAKRQAVAHLLSAHEMSERRACHVVGADQTMIRYRSRRPDDSALRERLLVLAGERKRFGYRRLHVLLRQEGHAANRKRIERLYRKERLTVRWSRDRKKARGTRVPILVKAKPNARWSVEFVHDQLVSGRRLRIFNVVYDVTKECHAAIADTSISGRRVARDVEATVVKRGKPELIVSDHRLSGGSRSDLRSRRVQEAAEGHRVHVERHARVDAESGRGMALHRAIEGQEAFDPPAEREGTRPAGRGGASRSRTAYARRSTLGCGTSSSTRRCSLASAGPGRRSPDGSPTTTIADRTPAIGYQTPEAYAARLTATDDRLPIGDALRQPTVAPSAQECQSDPVSVG